MTQQELATIGAVVVEAARVQNKFYEGNKYFFFFEIREDGVASGRIYDRKLDKTVQRTYELNIVNEPANALKMISSISWLEGIADGIAIGEANKQAEIDALDAENKELRHAAEILSGSKDGNADNKPEIDF